MNVKWDRSKPQPNMPLDTLRETIDGRTMRWIRSESPENYWRFDFFLEKQYPDFRSEFVIMPYYVAVLDVDYEDDNKVLKWEKQEGKSIWISEEFSLWCERKDWETFKEDQERKYWNWARWGHDVTKF